MVLPSWQFVRWTQPTTSIEIWGFVRILWGKLSQEELRLDSYVRTWARPPRPGHMRKAILYSILSPILQPLQSPTPPTPSISLKKGDGTIPSFCSRKLRPSAWKRHKMPTFAYMTLVFSFGAFALVTCTLPSPPPTIHLTRVYGEGCYSFTCHQPPFSKVHNRLHYVKPIKKQL